MGRSIRFERVDNPVTPPVSQLREVRDAAGALARSSGELCLPGFRVAIFELRAAIRRSRNGFPQLSTWDAVDAESG